jgi:O-antigen/teichoic acid export membrane protein
MALAQPAISTIYKDSYTQAPLYLALLSITYLFSALGNLSIGNLINSQGDTKYNLKLSIVTVAIGFPLSFILVSLFGIIGLIVASIIVGVPSLLWSIVFIKKRYDVSIDRISSAKIIISSSIAGGLTYLVVLLLPFSSPIQLIIGVAVFVLVFLFAAIITRTINRNDLANVREIVGSLGPLRKPLTVILNLLEKLMPNSK